MAQQDLSKSVPLINGQAYSFANVEIDISDNFKNVGFVSITKISYKTTRKKGNLYANTTEPESRFYGEKEYEASISMYKHMADKLRQASPTKSLTDLGRFNIIVNYVEESDAPTVKDILYDCEFLEEGQEGSKQEDGGLEYDYPLVVGHIKYGGQGGAGTLLNFAGSAPFKLI